MSKPVKNMITDSYAKRFDDVEGGVVISFTGIDANTNTDLRNKLAQEGIKVTVVKNTLARRAFAETALENFKDVLDGPSAIVYGKASEDVNPVKVARKLIDMAKEIKTLEFRGALMDGLVFTADEVEKLSKFPTREEALGQLVGVILGPASQIAGCLTGPGGQIAGILDTIKEKLENGEEIKKTA